MEFTRPWMEACCDLHLPHGVLAAIAPKKQE